MFESTGLDRSFFPPNASTDPDENWLPICELKSGPSGLEGS